MQTEAHHPPKPHAEPVHDELHDLHGMPHEPLMVREPSLPIRVRARKLFTRIMIGLYLPAIFHGMSKTFQWMFRKTATLQYPEETHTPRKGYRGEHRLKKDEHGHMKCVACFMCQTACPAECITIVAGPAPKDWEGREKVPVSFDIDMLKCIYCGMCEEACPCDAIELTTTYTKVSTSRQAKIYDMERLLRN